MCLKRREALSLGRFAERVLTCLKLSAADVPCKTAPFASFSGRTEKGGPARTERGPILLPLLSESVKPKDIAQLPQGGLAFAKILDIRSYSRPRSNSLQIFF